MYKTPPLRIIYLQTNYQQSTSETTAIFLLTRIAALNKWSYRLGDIRAAAAADNFRIIFKKINMPSLKKKSLKHLLFSLQMKINLLIISTINHPKMRYINMKSYFKA